MNREIVRATPAARRLAREQGLILSSIAGSGALGRIHLEDVVMASSHKRSITPLAKRIAIAENIDLDELIGSGYKGKIRKQDLMMDRQAKKPLAGESTSNQWFNKVKGDYIPLNPMRSTVAKRMSGSYFDVPAYTINIEVDMTELMAVRASMKELVREKVGEKLTVTDLLLMAVAKTLEDHPVLNAAWTEEGVYRYHDINVALAIGLEEGLYVPVIREANTLSISEIAKKSKELARKAVNNKLLPSDQDGPTFTISNIGMYGITSFNPIINMPSSAILGVGATIDRVVPRDGDIVVRPIMEMCLTLDHRVVDGTPAAKFMKDLKILLENPMGMFV
jgi:pyruvate dehydrogenase E2 component (dihydrolipoamide acetyltransferase)